VSKKVASGDSKKENSGFVWGGFIQNEKTSGIYGNVLEVKEGKERVALGESI